MIGQDRPKVRKQILEYGRKDKVVFPGDRADGLKHNQRLIVVFHMFHA